MLAASISMNAGFLDVFLILTIEKDFIFSEIKSLLLKKQKSQVSYLVLVCDADRELVLGSFAYLRASMMENEQYIGVCHNLSLPGCEARHEKYQYSISDPRHESQESH